MIASAISRLFTSSESHTPASSRTFRTLDSAADCGFPPYAARLVEQLGSMQAPVQAQMVQFRTDPQSSCQGELNFREQLQTALVRISSRGRFIRELCSRHQALHSQHMHASALRGSFRSAFVLIQGFVFLLSSFPRQQSPSNLHHQLSLHYFSFTFHCISLDFSYHTAPLSGHFDLIVTFRHSNHTRLDTPASRNPFDWITTIRPR